MADMNDQSTSVNITVENKIRRLADRGLYDRETIYSIIDTNYIAHVGFVLDEEPIVIPMAHWRIGDDLYIHSANKGRLAEACKRNKLCISIASVDGLVLARSAFNHSMNYRSVVIHGMASEVEEKTKKISCLKAFMYRLFPGRWDELRPVQDNELRSTVILKIPINSAAAKVRNGDPGDEHDDPEWHVWTGVVPITMIRGIPHPDPTMADEVPVPSYLLGQD